MLVVVGELGDVLVLTHTELRAEPADQSLDALLLGDEPFAGLLRFHPAQGSQPPARRSSSTSAASTSSRSSWSNRWRGSSSSSRRWASSGPMGATAAASNDARTGSSSSCAESTGAGALAELRTHGQHTTEQSLHVVPPHGGVVGDALGLADHVDLRARERIIVEPLLDAKALGADRREQVAPVGRARRLDDARHRADVEARVAASDLVAALDEHDAEATVTAEARLDQRAVSLLEDVQRQHRVREEDRAEWEHRQRFGHHPKLSSAPLSSHALGGAPRPHRPSRHPRRAGARASTSNSRAASANCPSRPNRPARSPR